MAGHSKWANIQHRKGRQDARRGKLFSRLAREISVAAKLGGADPSANTRLRSAVDSALANNMTKDAIARAIKRNTGSEANNDIDDVRYEGYGPNGVAVIVDCITNNKNRTVAEVRHIFSKYNGNLGTDGSVSYQFKKVGLIAYPNNVNEDDLMEAILAVGAEDMVQDDEFINVLTAPDSVWDVQKKLTDMGFQSTQAMITMQADTYSKFDSKVTDTILKLLDALEDLDDVQHVYSNYRSRC